MGVRTAQVVREDHLPITTSLHRHDNSPGLAQEFRRRRCKLLGDAAKGMNGRHPSAAFSKEVAVPNVQRLEVQKDGEQKTVRTDHSQPDVDSLG